jgi:hypothetical protein
MGNCICAIGWVDPQTSREVRGVLEETRGAIRDARTTVREQTPKLEATLTVCFPMSHTLRSYFVHRL